MEFIEYTNAWAKAEVYQAKIMLSIGFFLAIAFLAIYRSDNILLRGTLIPMGLMLAILLGYGSFMIYSRPAYAKEVIMLYQKSAKKAIKQEIFKHEKDNKAGKLLIRIYPVLMVLAVIIVYFVSSPYYKGMALGFVILFIATFIIDNGFISRSDAFLSFLKQ